MTNRIHQTGETYCISDEGGWLPGVYESCEVAELALKYKNLDNWRFLQKLQDIANENPDEDKRVITEDLILSQLEKI